ncbi:MAG TPA: glycerol-3-phosphate 1-O-acyltransferase PlsY [Tepidiformaceae bacterium]
MIPEYLINIALGYLLGSIPSGLLVGHLWLGRDIRHSGSGKTGTTNVLRTAGRLPAALVLIADVAKGVIPALAGRLIFDSDAVAAAGAAAALVGHVWPVFAGFRGGRGVATSLGGILGLAPLLALLFPLVGALIIIPTRIVSLMSIIGTPASAAIVVVAAMTGRAPEAAAVYAVFATAVILYMHIPNMRRLLAGTEPRIGRGGNRAATG